MSASFLYVCVSGMANFNPQEATQFIKDPLLGCTCIYVSKSMELGGLD
jgi:hypothetical protein